MYRCLNCGKRFFKTRRGFMDSVTVCSDPCKKAIQIKAENQFLVWGIYDIVLDAHLQICKFFSIIGYPKVEYSCQDFIIWLYLYKSSSRLELEKTCSRIKEL